MMERIDRQAITRDEAFKLTEKLIQKGTPNYIILDALIERGLSAYMANEVIKEARREHLNDVVTEDKKLSGTQIALIIVALAILLIIFFGIVYPVS